MSGVRLGRQAPDFTLPAVSGKDVSLGELRGSWVVLYFYPRDSTPGCTRESLDFQARRGALRRRGAVLLGVSRDSLRSHEKFRDRYGLEFELLSDKEERLCGLFDVLRQKRMYGREVRGIERSTFLIDPKGVVRREWRKLKVAGHAEEVLAALDEELRAER